MLRQHYDTSQLDCAKHYAESEKYASGISFYQNKALMGKQGAIKGLPLGQVIIQSPHLPQYAFSKMCCGEGSWTFVYCTV